jgi:hypothetical protein
MDGESPFVIDLDASPYQRRCMAGRLDQRCRILTALIDAEDPSCLRLAQRIASCCQHPQVAITEDGRPVLSEMRCRSRICPICLRRRVRQITARTTAAVKRMDSPRFLTLTLAHSDLRLRDQLIRLRRCFANLRRSESWKKHVIGGTYTVEVTFNRRSQQWHPHLHCIVDGSFFPVRLLSAAWLQATGDSKIVDIRPVPSASAVAKYIAGYVAKSSDLAKIPDDRVIEWVAETRGLRFLQQFGTLHAVRLDDDEPDKPEPSKLTPIGPVNWLVRAVEQGDGEARMLLGWILATRHGEAPGSRSSGDCEPLPGFDAIARSLRAWFRREQDHRRDSLDRQERFDRERRSRDRPQRLWQEPVDASHS